MIYRKSLHASKVCINDFVFEVMDIGPSNPFGMKTKVTASCPTEGVTMSAGCNNPMIFLASLKRIIRCTVSAGCPAVGANTMEQGHKSEDNIEGMTWKFKAIALLSKRNCELI